MSAVPHPAPTPAPAGRGDDGGSREQLELPVVRLQVQLRPLKPGRAPWRRYEPAGLHRVSQLLVTPSGAVGVDADGTEHLDVHHTEHPASRDRKGRNGISVMATGDYQALRERFGPHMVNGIAGESILVEHAAGLAHRVMPASLVLRGAAGTVLVLHGVHVAEPCVEFTRFCLGLPPSDRAGDDVTAALAELGGGARGYKMVAASAGRVCIGDVLTVRAGVPGVGVGPGVR